MDGGFNLYKNGAVVDDMYVPILTQAEPFRNQPANRLAFTAGDVIAVEFDRRNQAIFY